MARLTHQLRLSSLSMIASCLASTYALPTKTLNSTYFPPRNSTASSIEWGACPSDLDAPQNLQCATFSVPIDWDAPYGEHFDLGLVKVSAIPSNLTSKVGSLFINPGGPGGSASELIAQLALGAIQSEVFLASFDFIGLDPRGVGLSSQVQCDMDIYAERVSLFPETEEDLEKLIDKNKRLGESCRELTGPLLEHLDTISAAKDHEAVRVALGNDPINFVGMSYGSQLGAQYAALFPDNIRTLAIDGILQHSQSEAANIFIETSSYALGLTHFFDWASKNESSVLRGQDAEALWVSLLINATSTPIPAASCNGTDCRSDVNSEEIMFNAQSYLDFAGQGVGFGSSWELLASALYNATQGDASALSTSFSDPTSISGLAIGCLDWTHSSSSSLADILAQRAMATEFSPLTRGVSEMWQLQHSCLGWPIPVKNPPKQLDVNTKATILMTQSTADPITGLPWALGMLGEIRNKVLVLRQVDGHTSLPLGGKTAEMIFTYLITASAPEQGLVIDS